ncbi:methylated-DNA--[protein]-cysteine S-methyltransferase [Microgenomates group bacterium]|nr:methylated-DNA--[protein]-cysteine S-methyltransferase [Microgenomates group bacterium]
MKKYFLEKYKALLPYQKELDEYFSGERRDFGDLEISMEDWEGTEFQKEVWRAMREIPAGETRSYKWIASRIGRPKSTRAVGSACGKNPLPVIIPCHRVIKSDGSLGEYSGGGVEVKKALLEREGLEIRRAKNMYMAGIIC